MKFNPKPLKLNFKGNRSNTLELLIAKQLMDENINKKGTEEANAEGGIATKTQVGKTQFSLPGASLATPQSLNNLQTMKEALRSLDSTEALANKISGCRTTGIWSSCNWYSTDKKVTQILNFYLYM